MSKNPAFIVYRPPAKGFPFLAVILKPDGTATAHPFNTEEEALLFNREAATALGHGIKH
ncbi:hypothetical protein NKI51_00020 [Mesorhizobium australicum]|jgi:hypothetical protein|uniref:Uncharacterized protein n=1 Tax=Mesorhizobium australicum TaxID=536018 RepID=A0ACC6SXX7_9HYPH|nr:MULTISPECIES: hypothetical protein [unclassified Mesorhizobium]ESY82814.1 hypothetical protein X739_26515 [Mesorhizobium sp. LNHC220B00]ESY94280.1 hypothetical protein X741_12360 [Mesorhizobium sp. LNHC229A00]ESY98409.1 hypothetical protein X738_16965 [Mesorhizobium sp. LNHC209A00]